MGNSIVKRFFGKQEVRILIIGLDAAGKTSTLYTLKLGEVVTTIPTIGFNVETVQHKNVAMTVWDVGGRDKIRPLYRHYYQNTQGLVYVIDSNDRERFGEAIEELTRTVAEDELRDIPVMILANKQDLRDAMKPHEIQRKLLEHGCIRGLRERTWNVFGVCATDKENNGLIEAFDWLADQIHVHERNKFAANLLQGKQAVTQKNTHNTSADKNRKPFYSSFVESLKKMII